MPVELKLDVENRAEQGKGASRRLRRAKKVPAVLYGGHKDATAIQLDALQLSRLMEVEAFYTQILTLKFGPKKSEQAVVKDIQRHPFKPVILHLDLQRVVADETLRSHIPLHFLHQEEVVKTQGGVIHHDMNEVEVECLPKDLPQYIEVDCAGLKIGQALHLSDLKLPGGVVIPALAQGPDHDLPVVSLHATRTGGAAEEAAGEAEGETVE